MERLGIKEGESIESKMVTRAVENAQKKVESMHFEARKHLLEYDDVANEQRKTIYNFRNELLGSSLDMKKRIDELRTDYVRDLMFRMGVLEGAPKEEFDIKRLVATLKEEINCAVEEESLHNVESDKLYENVYARIQEDYEKKMSVVDTAQREQIEKILSLQVLDTAWREHLYQMDILKTGIGLRGYNQKDPLTEYKKESYGLFVELVGRIRNESFKMLQLVQLRDKKAEEEQQAMNKILHEMESAADNVKLQHGAEQIDNALVAKKIARNDLCPCGSGKKYKFCCGKSGPKKGLLA
jgi:preprotein translocase subunit SecA